MKKKKENKSELSRRKFLAASATGLVSAGLVSINPALALADDEKSENGKKSGVIQMRNLGSTGMSLPIVSMGAGSCNDPGMIQAAYEMGMRHFDTAATYQYGANEQLVGGVIKKMGVRDKVSIGTKIFTSRQRRTMSREQTIKKLATLLDGSLSRLRTDYVDILLIHSIDDPETVANDDIMEGMHRLKKQGKVRAIGISTHTNMAEVIKATTAGKIWNVVLTSINFTMEDDTELLGAIEKASQSGIGIIGMKVMAGGARWPNPDSRRDYSASVIASASLKWVLNNKHITTVIPAFNNHEHMAEDFAIGSSLKYSGDEKKFLGDNEVKLSLGFCRQCRRCLASCPNDAEIPTLMRTHMYAAQYGDFQLARSTFNEIPKNTSLKNCIDCSDCVAQCANTVDIKHRINELKLIYG